MAKFWPPCRSGRLCAPAPMDMRATRLPGLNFVHVVVSKDTSPEVMIPKGFVAQLPNRLLSLSTQLLSTELAPTHNGPA